MSAPARLPTIQETMDGTLPFLGQTYAFAVSEYCSARGERMYRLNPSYQRPDVWTTEQRENFIRSLFANIPVPPVIINELPSSRIDYSQGDTPYHYNVIDGRQRLTTLRMFMHGDLVVDGYTYETLPTKFKWQFENAPFPSIRVRFETEEEEAVYYNIFNYSGTKHEESDKAKIQ